MIGFISNYYASMLNHIQDNAASIILWLILFILVLVLFVLYLMHRINKESSRQAIKVADESRKKSEEVGLKIEKLNTYLKDVFRIEFGGAMESFDNTVSSVLSEMKEEMIQSINNIDRIESAVKGRKKIDVQVEAGHDKAQAMIADGKKAKAPNPVKEG